MQPSTLMWISTECSQRSGSHLSLPRSPEDVFFSQLRAETSEKTLLQPQQPGMRENVFGGRGEFPYERRNWLEKKTGRLQHDTNMKSTFMNMDWVGEPRNTHFHICKCRFILHAGQMLKGLQVLPAQTCSSIAWDAPVLLHQAQTLWVGTHLQVSS